MQELKLYYKEECPFCKKVLQYMRRNNVDGVELMDIKAYSKIQEELIRVGGMDQVPMLLIDGQPLYESDDIIQWFKDNK